MQYTKYILLTLYSFLIADISVAQNEVQVHFDKSFYTLGETIWYKVYLSDNLVNAEILEVQIADEMGITLMHQRLLAANLQANGEFRIPLNWEEAGYSFNILVPIEAGKSLHYQKVLPIFNDMLLEEDPVLAKTTYASLPMASGDLKISVATDKTTYRKGNKVQVEIKVTNAAGQPLSTSLSLAVKDQGLIPELEVEERQVEVAYSLPTTRDNQLLYLGKVTDTATGTAKQMNLVAIYNVEGKFVNWGKSDKDGQLSFALDPFYGTYEIQVRDFNLFGDPTPFDLAFQAAIPNDLLKAEYPSSLLEQNSAVKQYLLWSRERKRIEKMMQLDSIDFALSNESIRPTEPDRSYVIADYVAFKTLEEFIDEGYSSS